MIGYLAEMMKCTMISTCPQRQKRVLRQARETHDRCEHDAPGGNPDRVDDPDEDCASVCVARLVVDQGLADDEARFPGQVPEARRDVLVRKLLRDVGKEIEAEKNDTGHRNDLVDDGSDAHVIEEPGSTRRIEAHDDPFRRRPQTGRAALAARNAQVSGRAASRAGRLRSKACSAPASDRGGSSGRGCGRTPRRSFRRT
jgi:hypothetical protein